MSLVDNIESLIPQRWPFIMINELEYCEGDTTRSSFTVGPDNIFVVNGRLREPALVENIAQTAAARAGWLACRENRPVTLGYIGAIQKLEIFGLPATGDLVSTEIKVLNQVFDVTLVAGTLSCNGEVMASCEMKIFITKTP